MGCYWSGLDSEPVLVGSQNSRANLFRGALKARVERTFELGPISLEDTFDMRTVA